MGPDLGEPTLALNVPGRTSLEVSLWAYERMRMEWADRTNGQLATEIARQLSDRVLHVTFGEAARLTKLLAEDGTQDRTVLLMILTKLEDGRHRTREAHRGR